jgi:hypothetical protein
MRFGGTAVRTLAEGLYVRRSALGPAYKIFRWAITPIGVVVLAIIESSHAVTSKGIVQAVAAEVSRR